MPKRRVSEADVRRGLDRALGSAKSKAEVARRVGISRQHLHDILKGRRQLGPSLLHWLGYVERKEITVTRWYEEIDQ